MFDEAVLNTVYEQNPFVRFLHIRVKTLAKGRAELTMPALEKHTNIHKVVHGGAIASLADTAMGFVGATLGKSVVTVDMNINFLRGVTAPNTLTAIATVLHEGQTTMVFEAEVIDLQGRLIAKARGTFFVLGDLAEAKKASAV